VEIRLFTMNGIVSIRARCHCHRHVTGADIWKACKILSDLMVRCTEDNRKTKTTLNMDQQKLIHK